MCETQLSWVVENDVPRAGVPHVPGPDSATHLTTHTRARAHTHTERERRTELVGMLVYMSVVYLYTWSVGKARPLLARSRGPWAGRQEPATRSGRARVAWPKYTASRKPRQVSKSPPMSPFAVVASYGDHDGKMPSPNSFVKLAYDTPRDGLLDGSDVGEDKHC